MKAPTIEKPTVEDVSNKSLSPLNTELGKLLENDYSSLIFSTLTEHVLKSVKIIHTLLKEKPFSTGLSNKQEIDATTKRFYDLFSVMSVIEELPRLRQELQFFLAEPLATELAMRASVDINDYRKHLESLIALVETALSLKPILVDILSMYKPIMERLLRYHALCGNRADIDNLLMIGVDVNSQGQPSGKGTLHQLSELWKTRPTDANDVLITLCVQRANVNLCRANKRTALHDYCEAGAIELIDSLLEFQPDPTLVDSDGNTASDLLQKKIDQETSATSKTALIKAHQRLQSYQSYHARFLASQEVRRTVLEIYSTETLYRIGFSFMYTELGAFSINDSRSTFVELGLAVMHFIEDENSFTLSIPAAEYLYNCLLTNKNKLGKQTFTATELDLEKHVGAHAEFIMRFVFGDSNKRLKHLCNVLSVALTNLVIDLQKEFPCEEQSITDKRFEKLNDPKTTAEEMEAIKQELIDKHLALSRPFKLKALLNRRPHQQWILMNKTQQLNFLESQSALRCVFVTQECPELVKLFRALPAGSLLMYIEKNELTVATVLYSGKVFTQLSSALDSQCPATPIIHTAQINGDASRAMKTLLDVESVSKNERFDTALALSRRACQLDPENPSCFEALAESHDGLRRKYSMREFEHSVACYAKALALGGPYSTYYLKLTNLFIGRVQEMCGEDPSLAYHPMLHEALILCEKALATREIPGALMLMGDIYRLQGKLPEAMQYYRKSLEPVVGTGYMELELLSDQQRKAVIEQLMTLTDLNSGTAKSMESGPK